ncbi:MAG: putative porin, partial [Aquirufa sp.]
CVKSHRHLPEQKLVFRSDPADGIAASWAYTHLHDRYEIPAFVQADAYVTLRINRVRLFFKMQNVTQGLLNSNYYTAYLHPAMARSFGYGVRWLLFD